jgi:hypothetical protein
MRSTLVSIFNSILFKNLTTKILFGKIKKPVINIAVRDTLFGDLPVDYWASTDSNELPWNLFKEAKRSMDKGNKDKAIETLKSITSLPSLESRHYLQAYYFLSKLEVIPDGPVKIYGVLLEVGMPEGLDILAVYTNYTARYYNYSGRAIIWESSDALLENKIDNILVQSMDTVRQIGPWKDIRRSAPSNKMARINFLTSHGLHFGEATQSVLFNDPLASKILYALMDVRDTLIHKTSSHTNL